MDFIDRMVAEMRFRNISQTQLAEALETRQSTIGSMINRHSIPPADKADKIAKLLGVSLNYLLYGEEKQEVNSTSFFTTEEKEIIEAYRVLGWKDRQLIAYILERMQQLDQPL